MTTFYKQILRFGVTGVSNTLIDFGLFNVLIFFSGVHEGWQLGLINLVSMGLAATNSYVMNRNWTFNLAEKQNNQPVVKFIISTSLGMLINSLVIAAVSSLAHWVPFSIYLVLNVGKLLGAVFSSTWNFLIYRHWVFKPSKPPERYLDERD